jgi:serine/threonine-protein kinase/endoribonuclease IRE1
MKVLGPASPISTIGSVMLATAFAAGFIFRSKLPRIRLQMAPATVSVPSSIEEKTDGVITTPPPRPDTPVIHAMEISPVPSKPAPVTINSGPVLSPDDTPSHVPQHPNQFAEFEQFDTPSTTVLDIGEAEDSDREITTPKKRPRRGRRGKKGKGTGTAVNGMGDDQDDKDANGHVPEVVVKGNPNTPSLTLVVPQPPQAATSSLVVSDTILGFGSHGTVVYQGSLQGRAVAVKRLLQDFVTLASREVDILQESDDHPNVIRYYYQEAHANFLYIALELCPASLADVIESPDQFREISNSFDPKRALRQITSGLRHLHSLKIVHRDIKPQNILISAPKKGASGRDGGRRMLISDFGLCKKLEMDQTSFLPTAHGAMAAGTVGWRAPEILRGEVKLDDSMSDDHSQSSRGSVGTAVNGSTSSKPTRLTKSVDIFALGCLFYYVLTNGLHPFGDRFEREVNILKNAKSLDSLEQFGEEGLEAVDLITNMLDPEAYNRPNTTSCLLHPFFWDPGRRLNFLQDASDRFEIMCRDPRDQNLIILETGASDVVGQDWHTRLDKVFIENLGKYRKYEGKSVQDLLRALRNKKHHYQDLPDHVKRHLGPMPEGFLSYFTRRFPRLFMHVHGVISNTSLCHESMFRTYFELVD